MSDYPEVGTLLREANALMQAGALEAADVVYQRILAFDPAHKEATVRRIVIARRAGRRDAVLALIEAASRTDPSNPDWLVGRALALSEAGRYEDAFESYDRAIALDEACADAWFGKAQLLLQTGRYKEGWDLYEWRFYVTGRPGEMRLFRQPQWGGGGFHGQMLLVYAEQGLGDAIQFYRFVHQARSFGGVIVEAPEPLVRLFATQPQAPLVIPMGQPLPQFHLQCPMMSLPMLLGTELHSIPSAAYLQADPALASHWATRLPPPDGRLRVGISWAGNQDNIVTTHRDIPLQTMLEMLGADRVVVSLQKDVPQADRAALEQANVIDLGAELRDFADTAAVIGQLDLVVSVDTAVAHLAGAMGRPVWILLPEAGDWRWLTGRQDSPWYPTARLFRQAVANDWASVTPAIWNALRTLPPPRRIGRAGG